MAMSCAFFILAVAIISMARVIFAVLWTLRIRRLSIFGLTI
jgi:hypothetical protein